MTSNTALNDWIIDSEPVTAAGGAATDGDTAVGWSTQMHADAGQGNQEPDRLRDLRVALIRLALEAVGLRE